MTDMTEQKIAAITADMAKAKAWHREEWCVRGERTYHIEPHIVLAHSYDRAYSEYDLREYLLTLDYSERQLWWFGDIGLDSASRLCLAYVSTSAHGMLAKAWLERRQAIDIERQLERGYDDGGEQLTERDISDLRTLATELNENHHVLSVWGWRLLGQRGGKGMTSTHIGNGFDMPQAKLTNIARTLEQARTRFDEWVQHGIGSVHLRPWVRVFTHTHPHVSAADIADYLHRQPDMSPGDWWVGDFYIGRDEDLYVCYTPATAHGALAQALCYKRQYDDLTLVLSTDDSMSAKEWAELEEKRIALRESCDTLFTWGWRMLKAEGMRS